jgi:chemotaxis protein MotC
MNRIVLIAAGGFVLAGSVGAIAFLLFRPSVPVSQQAQSGHKSAKHADSQTFEAKTKQHALKLVDELGDVQDRIVRGDRDALAEQNRLLSEIGRAVRYFGPLDWDDFANVRTALIYVLSGGDSAVLQPTLEGDTLADADRRLAEGVLRFAKGQATAARKLLSDIDPRSLDVSLVGPFALARAALSIGRDDATAIALLDEARLAGPHTAIDEAAARREIPMLVGAGDAPRAMILMVDYVRRFGRSVYAWKLYRDFAEAIANRKDIDDAAIVAALVEGTAGSDPKARTDLFLDMAAEALLRGKLALAKSAAGEALKIGPSDAGDLEKAKLYAAAAEAPTTGAPKALSALDQVTADRLSDDDANLRGAADSIAHAVVGDDMAGAVARNKAAELGKSAPAGANNGGTNNPAKMPAIPRLASALDNADRALKRADTIISGNTQ